MPAAAVVDYYFALNSPWTYLGSARLEEIARRHGATVRVKPTRLGEVFGRTGGVPLPKRAPERQRYRLVELERWSAFLGVPLVLQPTHFPNDETRAVHLILAAQAAGADALPLATALGRQLWELDRPFADPATLAAAADSCGLDAEALLAAADPAQLDAAWTRNTEEAVAAGVFGAPSYVVEGEIFWGQDRLDFLERRLAG
ncbi:2-hydroxychromene-2-carboxylate isomerase [Caenispirillum bisanense]|uniref:2-hydroxychromene-2-carboxylate isomerase n=1 Tax=Caenispirillum bisanense TaxID=414052 RepID=A0A286G507_9PROT|nr:2-hydroxychromene-2-carboxylate isomerase [Caenispirillum bisanense]SOD90583.1 2-hydroxychromene-2-carboxylate isomerase [Caenispirillum bisanense]